MNSKKLSLVVTLATTTAILLVGSATLEGITHHYTNGFNPSHLKTRIRFNNFLKSELGKNMVENFSDNPDFLAVSSFVKNGGKGTLIAKENDYDEYFDFEYHEKTGANADSVLKENKKDTFLNWEAVDRYLKDAEIFIEEERVEERAKVRRQKLLALMKEPMKSNEKQA